MRALIGVHVDKGSMDLSKSIKWWVKDDKCWLRAKTITHSGKVPISIVRDGDTIKWYGRDGTLDGKGI